MFDLLFRFKGRISRQPYWIGTLGTGILLIALFHTVIALKLPAFIAIIASLLWTYVYLALLSKRLHDRGKSAVWIIPFYFVPALLEKLPDNIADAMKVSGSTSEMPDVLWWGLTLLGAAFALWSFIETGIRKDNSGPNHYGPDPLTKPDSLAA